MTMQITTTLSANPTDDARLAEILSNPGFGTHFSDHMFTVEWTPEKGWYDARITPYGPITLDPAAAVLHYAQETFEGMKAYRHADDSLWLFRPEANAERMKRSSHRLALPVLEVPDFVQAVEELVKVDARWVPGNTDGGEKSLYIRPFMFASEKFLGVRPAQHVTFMVITSPAGAYFKGGVKPVTPVADRGVHPGRPRRHGRGEDGRQLRLVPRRAAGGLRQRVRPGRLPRRPGGQVRRGARRDEHVLRLRRRLDRHPGDGHHPRGHHPCLDHRARRQDGPPGHRAQVRDRRVAPGRRQRPASPRSSPAGRPPSSPRSAP